MCRLKFAQDGSETFSKALSLQILSEMISEVMLLVSMCENDGDLDDDSQIGKQSDHSGDQLNHRAFKTVNIFKSQALLYTLRSLVQAF